MKIYMAPLEGITDNFFRNSYMEMFEGVDKVYTPFISPNDTCSFTGKEKRNIDVTKNDVNILVPQLLCYKAEHFLWGAQQMAQMGYKEVNLNLGCPSGTVVAKKKGSGFLAFPEELDSFLEAAFEGCDKLGIKLSIKTRIGRYEPEEFERLLEIYNKYPIYELTIHPRVQKDFYREPVKLNWFEYAYRNSKNPLVYNGEVNTLEDACKIIDDFPKIQGIMLGRGLLKNPYLPAEIKSQGDKVGTGESGPTGVSGNALEVYSSEQIIDGISRFEERLLKEYSDYMSGDGPALARMKELWVYWQVNFTDEKALKHIFKAKSIKEYKAWTDILLHH